MHAGTGGGGGGGGSGTGLTCVSQYRNDYFECLHHKKERGRAIEVQRAIQEQARAAAAARDAKH